MKSGFNPGPEEPPLRFEIAVTQAENGDDFGDGGGFFCPECGVLDPRLPHKHVMSVEFRSGCEGDVCRADLSLEVTASPSPPLVIGANDFVALIFVVSNALSADPAFRPTLRIPLPDKGVTGLRKTAKECRDAAPGASLLICDLPGEYVIVAPNTLYRVRSDENLLLL